MKHQNLIFSAVALLAFLLISIIYFSPVFSGETVYQGDIVKYKGSAKEANDYINANGEDPYWTNSMFGGMPTYQITGQYENDFLKEIDQAFQLWMPRPVGYFFIMLAGFYLLGFVLFKDWKFALTGALLFGFCTYFFIITTAGHNAKLHTIAYFAPTVAGILLLFQRKYILGLILTTLFLGLQLSANHPQMTYYLFLAMLVFVLVRLVYAIREKSIKNFIIAGALVALSGILAVGMNATRTLSTYEYGEYSIRGKSDISLDQNHNKEGLNDDYITQWSYGIGETFNLFIPNLYGGGSHDNIDELKEFQSKAQSNAALVVDSEQSQQVYMQMMQYKQTAYWGAQPFTEGPAYQGAIVLLLFVLGLFLLKGKWSSYKWWLLGATLLSFFLAWGKNMPWFTDLFIDYFPLYDKFRAVSSILVIAEFTMPLLGIIALYAFFKDENLTDEFKKKALIFGGGGVVALLILFYALGGVIFPLENAQELEINQMILQTVQANPELSVNYAAWQGAVDSLQEALKADRLSIMRADILRSLVFIVIALGLLLAYQFNKIKQPIIIVLGIGVLALADVWGVNTRYLNKEDFVNKSDMSNPYPTALISNEPSQENMMRFYNKTLEDLKKMDPSNYRVYNNYFGAFNETNTSYFHHSIGGYHGAKLQNYQNIIDFYLAPDSIAEKLGTGTPSAQYKVLAMLNTKYIISQDSLGAPSPEPFPIALGNAWLVDSVKWVKDANEEFLALKDINPASTAVLNNESKKIVKVNAIDSTDFIELKSYQPNKLEYEAKLSNPTLAVFSEIYYPAGWTATINGKPADILKTNYFLRGLQLPKGSSKIVMEFKPQVIQTGNTVSLVSYLLFALLILGGGFWCFKQSKQTIQEG